MLHPKYLTFLVLIGMVFLLENCKKDADTTNVVIQPHNGTSAIPATPQRTNGNAEKGYDYLINGDYINSGIPLEVYKSVFGASNTEDLGRTGDAKGISAAFNVVAAPNGIKVVSNNCLSCHSDKLNGKLMIGLGNNTGDNTNDITQQINGVEAFITLKYGKNTPEMKAFQPFARGFRAVAPYIKTEVQGANPADKIFAALSAQRNGADLKWLDQPQFEIPRRVVPTDVPAWWLLKKKNALYYNALGKGDMARAIMASALLTFADSTEARKIDTKFVDVLAYLKSIQAPKYPNPIDATLTKKGETLFINNCASCHGKQGAGNQYPNLLVNVETVGTDRALADEYATYPQYHTWYNQSWFAKGTNAAQLLPTKGYIAPPLDGIWATAPYLHNGSIPTLDDLLNSKQRPQMWARTFDNTADYDAAKVGWKYEVKTAKTDIKTYNTATYGYGNGGHTYGDMLTPDERKALIEYLKTL
jgi:mono/diheme cytochrome c family protein